MKEINIRHKNIDIVWMGGLNIRRVGDIFPVPLRMNGTVGWWIDRTTFFSVKQLKSILNQKKQL